MSRRDVFGSRTFTKDAMSLAPKVSKELVPKGPFGDSPVTFIEGTFM